MSDWNFTKWLGGFSGLGRKGVWSQNNILPDEIAQRHTYQGVTTKRFGLWNTVRVTPEEPEIPPRNPRGKGIIYLHGSTNGPFFEGEMTYDTYTERFEIKFEEISYPVYSDCANLRRMSELRENVGRVYGSIPYARIKDFQMAPIENGKTYIKRFEYQSVTKSSLDTTSPYRRNTEYYSKVFNELYEKGRPLEFEKKLCCSRCGQYYYTGALMPADQSASIAFQKDEDAPGFFYTVDDREEMRVQNPQHKQYIKAEEIKNLKDYKTIRAVNWDITKQEYDYRILYYPKWNFFQGKITGYQGATQWIECENTYGIKSYMEMGEEGSYITVQDYAQQNTFSYISHISMMSQIVQMCGETKRWLFDQEITTQVARTTVDKDEYAYETLSWHHSEGRMYENARFPLYEYNTKSSDRRTFGVFYTTKGDTTVPCDFAPYWSAIYGGNTHYSVTGGWPCVSTSRVFGHHWYNMEDVSLEYIKYDVKYLTWDENQNEIPGEFLIDPDNSPPLDDVDLNDEGIEPRNDEDSVDEEKKQFCPNLYQTSPDPFEITYVANFSTDDIELQCYVPHVFTNVQKYKEIGKLEKRLITATDEKVIYSTKILIKKSGTDGNKYSQVVAPNAKDYIVTISNDLYYLKQHTETRTTLAILKDMETTVTDKFDFNFGSEKVQYEDIVHHNLGPNWMNLDDLFNTPYYKYGYNLDNWERYGHDGYSFHNIEQRVLTAYSKYSFLAIGTPGLDDSVFNQYIFLDFLEDKSTIGEEEMPVIKHGEHETEEIDNNFSDNLFDDMSDKEWQRISYNDNEYPSKEWRLTETFLVSRPPGKFTCLSYGTDAGCGKEDATVSIPDRGVTVEYPWILLKTENDDGWIFNTYGLDLDEHTKTYTWEEKNPYPAIHSDYRDSDEGYASIDPTPKKKKTPAEISPVWENVSIPSYYLWYWPYAWNQFALSYSERVLYCTKEKGHLLKLYNANYNFIHPWSGSILTGIGCCPIRLKDKYLVFDGEKTATKNAWAPSFNQPYMINRFHSSGCMFVNYISDGVYAHPDGDKFIIISPWFTDIEEGLSGIQLQITGLTDFANGKCATGFNISCDSALVATYNIDGPRVSSANIYSVDKESSSKYTVNKGIFPIIKGLWQPKADSKAASNMANALLMIETQCMIEGPEYFFGKNENDFPPGFEKDFKGYMSRGLMVAISTGGKYHNYLIGGKDCGFFNYFKPQNEKREKINCRRAHDTKPKAMRKEEGYYWDCEEAFGPYEIASPFTFETQIAAKLSFTVRVGENYCVLFLLAYDIDKWPCTAEDTPSDETSYTEINPQEEYKFKSAYFALNFGNGGTKPTWSEKFQDFTMEYIFTTVKLDRAEFSSRQLDKLGLKYFEYGKKTYKGIIVPKVYTGKNAHGLRMLPHYNIDESYSKKEENKVKRGIVRLIRWRTFEWKVAKLEGDGITPQTDKNGDVQYDNYTGAIAQVAVDFDQTFQPDMYYTGGDKSVLLCFYQKEKSTKIEVKNLHIPNVMVWQENKTTDADLLNNEYKYEEHLLNLTQVGIFDTVVIEKRAPSGTSKKDYNETFMLEALTIPVVSTSGHTYLCVTKDCEHWEIAGRVDQGVVLKHLAAGYLPPESKK